MTARPFKTTLPGDLKTDEDVLSKLRGCGNWPDIIQIGGNTTIGKGFMKVVLFEEEV